MLWSVVPIILGLTAKVSPAIMVHIYNCHAVFNKVVKRSTPLSLLLPYMFPYQQLKINGSSNWSVHVNSKHWLIYRELQICSIRSEKNWIRRSQVVLPIFFWPGATDLKLDISPTPGIVYWVSCFRVQLLIMKPYHNLIIRTNSLRWSYIILVSTCLLI